MYVREKVAPEIQDETAREALQQSATASMIAAATIVGDRSTAIASPKVQVDGKALAAVERGRSLTQTTAPIAAPATAPPKVVAAEAKAVKNAAGKVFRKAAGFAGVIAGVAALVSTARAQGVGAAAREAVDLVDPTNGLAGRAIDAVAGGNDSPLQALAKQQAAERAERQNKTGVNDVVEMHRLDAPEGTPTYQGQLPVPSSILQGGLERGTIDPRQAALFNAVNTQGLDGFYAGFRPSELLAREPHQELAAQNARDVAARDSTTPLPSPRQVAPPQQTGPTGAPRGFQIEHVRQAALDARKTKLGY